MIFSRVLFATTLVNGYTDISLKQYSGNLNKMLLKKLNANLSPFSKVIRGTFSSTQDENLKIFLKTSCLNCLYCALSYLGLLELLRK